MLKMSVIIVCISQLLSGSELLQKVWVTPFMGSYQRVDTPIYLTRDIVLNTKKDIVGSSCVPMCETITYKKNKIALTEKDQQTIQNNIDDNSFNGTLLYKKINDTFEPILKIGDYTISLFPYNANDTNHNQLYHCHNDNGAIPYIKDNQRRTVIDHMGNLIYTTTRLMHIHSMQISPNNEYIHICSTDAPSSPYHSKLYHIKNTNHTSTMQPKCILDLGETSYPCNYWFDENNNLRTAVKEELKIPLLSFLPTTFLIQYWDVQLTKNGKKVSLPMLWSKSALGWTITSINTMAFVWIVYKISSLFI